MQIIVKYICQVLFCNRTAKSPNLLLIMENTGARTLRSRASFKSSSLKTEGKKKPPSLNIKTETAKHEPSDSKRSKDKDNSSKARAKTAIKPEQIKIKSEYFEDQNELTESGVKLESAVPVKNNETTKKRRQVKSSNNTSLKPEKISKVKIEPQNVSDIEDGIWQPENWKEVLDNILKMRKLYVAPVDSLGCEECPEKGVLPEVFRYQTLISVMLSSQTRDEVTFAATQRLIEHGLTIDNILSTPDEKIGELIYPAGFWKSKIKFIKNTTQILKDQYKGDIPRTFKELCKLPGVGPKMANIVMSVAWNDTVGIAVDTHVHRISNRLGWVPKPTKDPEQTRKALESWLPKDQWRPINLTLVGFGQTVCRPVGPSCEKCLNKSICPFGKTVLSAKRKKNSKN